MKTDSKFFYSIFDYLRKKGKSLFDRIRSERARRNLLTAIPFWAGSLIVGVAAVFYARLFAFGETILNRMIHNREWVLFFIMPVCFVAAWWIVKKWAPYARG
ncbi:MAG: hypothetical protein QM640_14985, partial [Niabella sp.]